ncbi:hypothetical protein SLS56_008394 [Neofusicoccum ribis]|uniref:DUF676 domain-containing protein n=1 Tax=Neofusicoccum ribis TaxID=45134 RepID=A0ABR3SKN7_9PEZI
MHYGIARLHNVSTISGLNGHAFGSFKKKNSPYMWLRDDLPRDLLEYRVIVYGYDSKLEGSRSIQNLLDIGTKFRNAVREARPRPEKPLILLGHSLGGIVIKEALNLVRTGHTDTDRMTFKAIKGIIFFGVPSQGMDISSLIPMVGNQANRGFLHTLGQNSPVLRTQAQRFSAALEDLNCEILSFYETQESPTARKNLKKVSTKDPDVEARIDRLL